MNLDAQPRDLRSKHPRDKNTWNLIICYIEVVLKLLAPRGVQTATGKHFFAVRRWYCFTTQDTQATKMAWNA